MSNTPEKLAEIFSLSKYEAALYLAATGFSRASLTELAEAAAIPRTAAYPPIQSLMKKGLISATRVGKRKFYSALDPKQLGDVFERRKLDLNAIISELTQKTVVSQGELAITYYPGKNGIATAHDIFLADTKTKLWKTFENPVFGDEFPEKYQFEEYIERRVTKKIWAKCIIPLDIMTHWVEKHLKNDEQELRKTLLVPPSKYAFTGVVAVTKGMILLIAMQKNSFAVIIKNEELAETVSAIHDMAWDAFGKGSTTPV